MKDIAALCQRVVVITDGAIKFDGSLSGIVDSFSGSKILKLQLADGQRPEGLERFAEVESIVLPKVTLRCQRSEVPKMLASILQHYQVDDVAVEDREDRPVVDAGDGDGGPGRGAVQGARFRAALEEGVGVGVEEPPAAGRGGMSIGSRSTCS